VNPQDPNNLIGPAGYGTQGFIQPSGTWAYTVDFENDGTAAAQDVTATEQLDTNLDWSTFQLGSFGFGSMDVTIPAGLTQYQTTVAYQNTDGSSLNVQVALDFNVQTGLLTVTFTSLDPATGQTPAGVFDGFLPPDNSSGIGEGFVQYTVQPNAGLATGDTINQQASVVFDTNTALATNVALSTIDATNPVTTADLSGPAGTNGWYTDSVQVTLSATDATSGVASTEYQVDGGTFQTYSGNSFTVSGDGTHTIVYYSIDNAGNQEGNETATFKIDTTKPVTTASISGPIGDNGWYIGSVLVTLSATDATSGVAATEYQVDGGSFLTYSGSPLTVSGDGTHTVTYYSTDNAGNQEGNETATFGIAAAPAITSAAGTTFTVGKADKFTVTTTGYPAATLAESGTLPVGVAFVDNGNGTATLSGTPAATTGDYVFDITADNPAFSPIPQTFTLAVTDPPIINSAAGDTFTVGKAGKFTIKTTPGLPATTTLSEKGKLPNGVTFKTGSNGTATLSGTPATGSGGLYNLTIAASDASGATTQPFTLTVDQAPAITSAASAIFTVGNAGKFTVTTTGYPTAALSETGLPAGFLFSDNGNGTATLSGTPATTGVYHVTITANGTSPAATQKFTLTVDQTIITSQASEAFLAGSFGNFTITTTLGTAEIKLSESGKLPKGVTFVDNRNGTATLWGTPAAGSGGVYPFTITAGNAPPSSLTTQAFTLTVVQAPAVTSAAGTIFTVGSAGKFTVTTTGYPTAALSETGTLPAGVTWVDNGNGTATLGGTPAAGGCNLLIALGCAV
jgi:uncharacterized repeat protein (TIGR01451 family)